MLGLSGKWPEAAWGARALAGCFLLRYLGRFMLNLFGIFMKGFFATPAFSRETK